MGILNASPDSFSDGEHLQLEGWKTELDAWVEAGVAIVDLGGQSTRPGHTMVGPEEEWRRIEEPLHWLHGKYPELPISIDTQHREVLQKAMAAGASCLNDVTGLRSDELLAYVQRHAIPSIAMRWRDHTTTASAIEEMHGLEKLLPEPLLMLDPGLGFGDGPGAEVDMNLGLLDQAPRATKHPVLIGHSRKRFVGTLAAEPDASKRGPASVDLSVRAARAGAAMVRVHDVLPTLLALERAGLLARPT